MTWRGGGKQTNGCPKNIFLSIAHFYPRRGAIMDSNLSQRTTPRTFLQPKKICYTTAAIVAIVAMVGRNEVQKNYESTAIIVTG